MIIFRDVRFLEHDYSLNKLLSDDDLSTSENQNIPIVSIVKFEENITHQSNEDSSIDQSYNTSISNSMDNELLIEIDNPIYGNMALIIPQQKLTNQNYTLLIIKTKSKAEWKICIISPVFF